MSSSEQFVKVLYDVLKEEEEQQPVLSKEDFSQMVRELCYAKYVVKEHDIPMSYYKSKEEKMTIDGHGKHNLVKPENSRYLYDVDLKKYYTQALIREQKDGIDSWFDYFTSEESNSIPLWAKMWAFLGVLKTASYHQGVMEPRRDGETSFFARLDKEVLEKSIKEVKKKFKGDLSRYNLRVLLRLKTFKDLFGIYFEEYQKKVEKTPLSQDGIWVDFYHEILADSEKKKKQGEKTEFEKLHDTVKGFNTGWKIEGILNKEDSVYHYIDDPSKVVNCRIYLTKDETGNYSIPRMMMTLSHWEEVLDVQGIGPNQKVEGSLESILNEKLNSMKYGEKYIEKKYDLDLLDRMYQNYQIRELTLEELTLLYSYSNYDPRVEKMKRGRDRRKDLAIVYDCTPEEIGIEKEDLYKHQLVYYEKSIIYHDMYQKILRCGFQLPKIVKYGVILPNVTDDKDLILPDVVGGTLALPRLRRGHQLKLSRRVYTCLDINNLETLVGVELPEVCGLIYYHNKELSLKEAKQLQEEELARMTSGEWQESDIHKTYGMKAFWYYKNGLS